MVDDTIRFVDITDGATHYHADYVMPSWASTKTKTVEIEDHIFYRWEK
jgi:spore germination cell wall hydrolase CwlJ-like protein